MSETVRLWCQCTTCQKVQEMTEGQKSEDAQAGRALSSCCQAVAVVTRVEVRPYAHRASLC